MVVQLKRVIALLLLVLAASAASLQITEPSGSYGHGTIPVSATFVAGETVKFELMEGGKLLETSNVDSATADYSTSFEVNEKGSYSVKATARHNETDYENSTSFEVTTSKIYVTILSPEDTIYYGAVLLEAEATQDDLFLHGADVAMEIGNTTYSLPEAQNSYRAEAALGAGEHTAELTVSKGGQTASASVEFTVAGEAGEGNETIYVPGLKAMEIKRVSPTRAQYGPGEEMVISVYLLDNQNQRVAGAGVSAIVKTPSGAEQNVALSEKLVGGKTVYEVDYLFAEDGFYEAKVTASKSGHKDVELYMPTIRVGEEAPELPEDVFCQYGICIRVESPSETETYPDGTSVKIKVQVIDESASPVADATVTAKWGNTTKALTYDWNGYYGNTTGNMSRGDYAVMLTAAKGGISVSKNITLHVSPDRLVIMPLNPLPGGNVTDDFTTMQVKLTDQDGETVTGANVRAVVTTPLTGTHTVQLSRNTATGFYESEYTFIDTGQYTLKLVASKIGYVSSESVYTFDVVVTEEGVRLTEEDVVIAALIIGVLLIIATLWKALL
ncbi:MAG: hypothetical protein KAW41_03420 [Candidatus Diapherotrites archaeon]|nr:hypothetical protein [Candidatus Diapherotrites archaeon]